LYPNRAEEVGALKVMVSGWSASGVVHALARLQVGQIFFIVIRAGDE
jgi:hypothetical protein